MAQFCVIIPLISHDESPACITTCPLPWSFLYYRNDHKSGQVVMYADIWYANFLTGWLQCHAYNNSGIRRILKICFRWLLRSCAHWKWALCIPTVVITSDIQIKCVCQIPSSSFPPSYITGHKNAMTDTSSALVQFSGSDRREMFADS